MCMGSEVKVSIFAVVTWGVSSEISYLAQVVTPYIFGFDQGCQWLYGVVVILVYVEGYYICHDPGEKMAGT